MHVGGAVLPIIDGHGLGEPCGQLAAGLGSIAAVYCGVVALDRGHHRSLLCDARRIAPDKRAVVVGVVVAGVFVDLVVAGHFVQATVFVDVGDLVALIAVGVADQVFV